MMGQQKTLQTRMNKVSVLSQDSHAWRTAEDVMVSFSWSTMRSHVGDSLDEAGHDYVPKANQIDRR
jgi:hypothetical protein